MLKQPASSIVPTRPQIGYHIFDLSWEERIRKSAVGSPDKLLLDDCVHGLHLGVLNDSCDLQLLDTKAHRDKLGCKGTQRQA